MVNSMCFSNSFHNINKIPSILSIHTKKKYKLFVKVQVGIHWLVCGALVAGLIWFTFEMQQVKHEASSIESGLYTGFSRLIWSIIILMVIYACITGHGGPVNSFLSLPLWRPLARLTYAIYLVHMPVMMLNTASTRRPVFFSFRNIVRIYTLSIYIHPQFSK